MSPIITWTCEFCGWANDNNDGPCRKCGAQTEERLINGKWRTVTIKQPNKQRKFPIRPARQ